MPMSAASATDIDQLLRTELFAASSPRELAEVASFSERIEAPARARLIAQGQPCEHVFVLIDGAVKLLRDSGNRAEKVVDFVEPVAVFGETAMLTEEGYPYAAVAVEPCKLLTIRAAPLLEFLHARPARLSRLLRQLGRREARLLQQVERRVYFNAEQKIAAYLLDHYDRDRPRAPLLGLPRRRTDMASMLSLTPETLSREIGKLKRRGWIAVRAGRIAIRRPERLSNLF